MKIQIDTNLKIIKVEESINFGELIEVLEKMLPNQWREFKLETGTIIYWNDPIQIFPTQPYYPTWPWTWPWPQITWGSGTYSTGNASIYNYEIMSQ